MEDGEISPICLLLSKQQQSAAATPSDLLLSARNRHVSA